MIFILEDEHAIRELIEYALNTHSLESKGFATPSAFFEALNALSEDCMPELILLDMMLPRARWYRSPKDSKEKAINKAYTSHSLNRKKQ